MTKKSEIYVDDTSFMGLGGCIGDFKGGVWVVWGVEICDSERRL